MNSFGGHMLSLAFREIFMYYMCVHPFRPGILPVNDDFSIAFLGGFIHADARFQVQCMRIQV
jgi:hypothetical protein